MDSSSQIDTVQKFAEVIGDNDDLWKFLIGKEVIRFKAEITYGIKGIIVATYIGYQEVLITVNYNNRFKVDYDKDFFVEYFNTIYPALYLQEIIPIVEKANAQRLETQRLEDERREAKRLEAQKRVWIK
jgi:DNA helicase-4